MSNKGYDTNKRLGGGYAQRTALYHLMEEGVADATTLASLSGCMVVHMNQCLQRMAKSGIAQWAPQQCTPVKSRRFIAYALTPLGIEAALAVDPRDVEFASPPPNEQPVVIGIDMGSSRGDFTVLANFSQSIMTHAERI